MFSVVATETSALTFISIPGLAYLGDLGFLQIAAGYILGRIVVARVLLPRYYNGQLVTAYTLLETRFGVATRRFTSIVFMVTRALADSVRVFATAIPVALIVGPALGVGSERGQMVAAILVLGALTVLYTYRGGMRAVVWTELLQAGVYLLGGAAAIVLIGRIAPGGWHGILGDAAAAGKLRVIDLSTGFDRPQTLFAGLLGGAFLAMASHGADQLIVQRLLSARSLRDAQRAVIGSGIAVFAQFTLFLMIGIGLWAIMRGRSFAAPDAIFPTFIVEQMPVGLLGLVVAAIVAATMSTHAGAINALAAATTHDIYLPLTKRSADDPRALRTGKLFALALGGGAHSRGPALPDAGDAGRGGRPRDRELHLWRAARWLLSGYLVVAREAARRDHRHEHGDRGDGGDRLRGAARPVPPRARAGGAHRVAMVCLDRDLDHDAHGHPQFIHARCASGEVMSIVVGVDGGGTGSRCQVSDDSGTLLGEAHGGAGAMRPGEADRAADAIVDVVRDGLIAADRGDEMPKVLCVGAAGVGRDAERLELWEALSAREIAEDVVIITDAEAGFDDAFGEGAGILLIAGTGSIAHGRGPTGIVARCGGWGPVCGDEGSGAWIGRRTLSAVTASSDGREPPTALPRRDPHGVRGERSRPVDRLGGVRDAGGVRGARPRGRARGRQRRRARGSARDTRL